MAVSSASVLLGSPTPLHLCVAVLNIASSVYKMDGYRHTHVTICKCFKSLEIWLSSNWLFFWLTRNEMWLWLRYRRSDSTIKPDTTPKQTSFEAKSVLLCNYFWKGPPVHWSPVCFTFWMVSTQRLSGGIFTCSGIILWPDATMPSLSVEIAILSKLRDKRCFEQMWQSQEVCTCFYVALKCSTSSQIIHQFIFFSELFCSFFLPVLFHTHLLCTEITFYTLYFVRKEKKNPRRR